MLLSVMNMPGLGRPLFSGGTAALKGINKVIVGESCLDVGQFKVPLGRDTHYPTIDYLDLELAPSGNYHMKAASPTRVIPDHIILTGSTLAFRLLRSGAMEVVAPLAIVARPFVAITTAASGLSALRNKASAYCAGHHGGDFDLHIEYVFCGAHDYARVGSCHHYGYTNDAGNCHSDGEDKTSGTSA